MVRRSRLAFLLCFLPFALPPALERLRADEAEDREALLQFNTASRFYRQKNWRDAASTFGDFLKKFPGHADAAEARFAAGYCWNRVGDHATAVEILRLAAKDVNTPWSADASFYLGRSLEALAGGSKDPEERTRRLVDAAESYGRASAIYDKLAKGEGPAPAPPAPGEKAPSSEEQKARNRDFRVLAIGAQGEALYQAQKHKEAAHVLEVLLPEAESLSTTSSSSSYQRALFFLGISRQALARALSEGRGAAKAPRYQEARVALEAASDPQFEKEALWEEAAYILASLAYQDGDLDKAVEVYGRVMKKAGERGPQAAFYRGLALYESQKPERLAEARNELTRFLKDHPQHALAPKARFYAAHSAFDLKDYAGCEAPFRQVAAENPELAGRALLRLGQALLLKPNPSTAGAAETLAKAVEALEGEVAGPKPDPTAAQRLAEALYWQGEALLEVAGKGIEAAQAFGAVHTRFTAESPELAEKSLYQMARTLFLAGSHAPSAEACQLYLKHYPKDRALFHAECLLLAAECAFHAPAGKIPEDLRRDAPRLYEEAGATLKDPGEAARAKYMSGVALYFLGDYKAAAQRLDAAGEEARRDPKTWAFPELTFYLADSLAQQPRQEVSSNEDRERWRRAAGLYVEYLERSKDGSHLPNALVNLGLCQEWLEDHDGARKTFERFLAAFPSHELASQVRFELGNTRLVAGDLEAAALAYASAADSAGATENAYLSARALYQKAMLERKLGKPANAAETLALLLEKHGEAIAADDAGAKLARDASYQKSVALLEAGKADDARRELGSFLEKNAASPQEGDARSQLARSLLDAGKAGDALGVLEPLLAGAAAAPGRDQALYIAAWCHSALAVKAAPPEQAKHQEEMESSYRRLIAEHPQSPFAIDAMLELGQHLFNRRAYAESKKWLAQVREILETETVPAQPDVEGRSRNLLERSLFGLGFIAFEEGDYPQAAKVLERVATNAQSPLAPRAAFQAGRAFMKAANFGDAAPRFQRVADELKGRAGDLHEESLLRWGECLHQLQKYEEAVRVLDRLLAEYPEGSLRHEGRFAKGFALQFLGNHEGAIEAYRAVVAGTRTPVAARAQYHIGECRQEQGRHREAAREFNTAVANFDFDGEYREWVRRSLLAAGMAFQTAGEGTAAAAQLKELVDRFPETDEGKAAAERLRELGAKK